MDYLTLKWIHVLSSTILFGTGVGSAYYFLRAHLSRDARIAEAVSRYVIVADWMFTATTVLLQPLTGLMLARMAGIPLSTPWLHRSFVLYGVAVACWVPVVFIQIRMHARVREAAARGERVTARQRRWLAAWIALGTGAFFAFLAVFHLMVAKTV